MCLVTQVCVCVIIRLCVIWCFTPSQPLRLSQGRLCDRLHRCVIIRLCAWLHRCVIIRLCAWLHRYVIIRLCAWLHRCVIIRLCAWLHLCAGCLLTDVVSRRFSPWTEPVHSEAKRQMLNSKVHYNEGNLTSCMLLLSRRVLSLLSLQAGTQVVSSICHNLCHWRSVAADLLMLTVAKHKKVQTNAYLFEHGNTVCTFLVEIPFIKAQNNT